MRTADDEGAALWPDRYLTEGRLVVVRSPRREPSSRWARLRAAAVRLDRAVRARLGLPSSAPEPPSPAPEAAFAAWDTTEARVAAAAGRAWAETVREPSWSSPLLAASRFDGQAEVDRIVDLALRIRSARVSLGVRPPGTAAEYWDRQSAALEAAALRLGHRADALIRYPTRPRCSRPSCASSPTWSGSSAAPRRSTGSRPRRRRCPAGGTATCARWPTRSARCAARWPSWSS